MIDATSFVSGQTYKAMYHEADTRYNLCELPPIIDPSSRAKIEQQARSIACLVTRTLLIETNSNGAAQFSISPRVPTLTHKLKTGYEEGYRANCTKQKRSYREEEAKASYQGPFQNELSLGDGTAFLVGKQLILTAAHCICDKASGLVSKVKLTSLRVLFGFQMQFTGQARTEFEPKDVYDIDAVLQYRLKSDEADWALLKLDREVEGRDPLSLAASQTVSLKTALYMLGHPSGLPLKLTMSGQVQKTHNPHFFETDLDAFAGNSGSPVFENGTGNMLGMLLIGNQDYSLSTSLENKNAVTIHVSQVSKQDIEELGYEKCHKIASIGFVKTVLSSSFKMAHSHFSGRTKHLAILKAHLAPSPLSNPSQSTRVQILYGPGGVGKSELAITFANQSIEDFSFIWSISCGTVEEHLIGYSGLARRFEIPLDEKESLPSLINKVHRRLEQNSSKPWLLLLDNLQTLPEPPNFPPLPDKGGSILITSYKGLNIHSLPQGAAIATEVLPLEPEEALNFLEMMTKKPSDDCKKLLGRVGCYPLVLGQVASYIKHTGIEVETYLANLERRHPVSVAQENPSKNSKMALEAAFWMTLQELSPSAKKWLFLCSQLNAALIPLSYLKTWLSSQSLAEEQAAIIVALEEHALLRYNVQEEVFSLHLEFQRILRSVAPVDMAAQVAHLLVNMRNRWDFNNTSNWGETMKKATIWASHAEPVVKATGQVPLNLEKAIQDGKVMQDFELKPVARLNDLERASLLDGLGEWEYANARYEKAQSYRDEALEHRKAASVPATSYSFSMLQDGDSEESKSNRENMAARGENVGRGLREIGDCDYSQGFYNEALQKYLEALTIQKKTLGEDHPDVASSLNRIGNCYYCLENYQDSLKAYSEAVGIAMNPERATSLAGIGNYYYSQGKYEEALTMHEDALKHRKDTFGEDHPDVAKSLNNIGNCYKSLGNYTEALKKHEEALRIKKASLVENHPEIAKSLNNIGICYDFQKNYNKALKFYNDALSVYRATLKENHPDVARTLQNIVECRARLDRGCAIL